MKFVINSGELLSAMQTVTKAQTSKPTLPILDCIRMEMTPDGLYLMAADADQTITTTIPVNESVGVGSSVCVPAQLLLSSLKELPDQPITFVCDDNSLACTLDFLNGKFNFVGQPANEFPTPIRELNNARTLTLPSKALSQGFANTKNSIANDVLRPQMNGVYIDVQGNGYIGFVASDGHSLSRYNYHSDSQIENPFGFIIPSKSINVLTVLLAKAKEDVTITLNDTNFITQVNGYTLSARLVEGRYPNYNSVIPKDNPFNAQVERDALISAVRRVLVFANAASALIKFAFSQDEMIVSAQDLDFSTSAEEHVLCEYSQDPISIGFSGTMLIDLLRQMPSTTLNVAMADPSRAGIITPTQQEEDADMLLLLMPMMLEA